jgi:hypothetical protein
MGFGIFDRIDRSACKLKVIRKARTTYRNNILNRSGTMEALSAAVHLQGVRNTNQLAERRQRRIQEIPL